MLGRRAVSEFDIDSFCPPFTHTEIALKLIESSAGRSFLVRNLSDFEGLDHADIVNRLIEKGDGELVAEHLSNFKGVDHVDIAHRLIEEGDGWSVAECLFNFKDVDHVDIARRLIETGRGEYVARKLFNFEGLDADIAHRLIEEGYGESVAELLSSFEGLDHADIAHWLIETGRGDLVAYHSFLSKFEGLGVDIAHWLIETGHGKSVPRHLSSFEGSGHADIARRLIEEGYGESVVGHLSSFEGSDHADIARRLIEKGDGWRVAKHLPDFKGVDHADIARRIIEKGHGDSVAEYLHNFKGVDHVDMAHRLIEKGSGRFVAVYLINFKGVDHADIARRLIEKGDGDLVAELLSSFEGLDHADIAHWLIKEGHGESVVWYLPDFKGVDHVDVARWLIEKGDGWLVAEYLSRFKDVDHTEVVDDLIKHDQKWVVVWYAKELGASVQATEDECRESFRKVKEVKEIDETIADSFKRAADLFGYKKMFRYKEREGLSFHDATYELDGVCDLCELSGLDANTFYANILDQVRQDTQEYEEGTAHHSLNAIVTSLNTNIPDVIEEAEKHSDIERLQELAETLKRPEDVFASWSNLKRYRDLSRLLDEAEILDELKELKKEGKDDLYRYIQTLAFHPDSKVNMQAVLQFWRNPEDFLNAHDMHTPDKVQNRKKPSNYTDIPNLDLTAENLRDALVGGVLDRITMFPPMEIRYSIPEGEETILPTRDALRQAVGIRSKGVQGTAKNATKLFSEVNKMLKRHKTYQESRVNINKYLDGEDIPEDLERQVTELLYDEKIGIQKPKQKTREYVARITSKSDPEGALAGDDTANCMPYGSGKNTVYTFNPNTAQFIIRAVRKDGTERTVAQSVLTKDSDVRKSVPDIINELQSEKKMDDVLPEDVLTEQDAHLACDNIEVAPSYAGGEHENAFLHIYRDFFKKYTQKEKGFRTDKIIIGTSFADALTNLPKEENTYVPQAPVGYSDKTGTEVYALDLGTEHTETEEKKAGISPLTFEDSLKVGWLEGKAYGDNVSLIESLFNLENALIAKDINNEMKNRPNLSTKYTDSTGRVRGYLLAYEGAFDDEDKPCIYISDLASDRESTLTGGRLIKEFVKQYKEHYLDKNNPLPIYAQARETTTYRIIKKQIDNLAKQTGTEFELIELPTYEQGDDTMHPIVIQVKGD